MTREEEGFKIRLIDADALIKSAENFRFVVRDFENPFDAVRYQGKKFREMVENAPTVDAVPVVRCRDCKHAVEIEKDYIRKLFIDGTKECDCGRGDLYYGASIISPDGFCDSGERRDNG